MSTEMVFQTIGTILLVVGCVIANSSLSILPIGTADSNGRMIDLYTQYPAPFGGQGSNKSSDMFWLQMQVELYANVTINNWPVQQKDVAFEVEDPSGNLWTALVARTNDGGVSHVSLKIPPSNDHPESLLGLWTLTGTADVAGAVVKDTLKFFVDDLVPHVCEGFGGTRVNNPQDPRYGQYWHPIQCPECPHTPDADLNMDNNIDVQDLAMAAAGFG